MCNLSSFYDECQKSWTQKQFRKLEKKALTIQSFALQHKRASRLFLGIPDLAYTHDFITMSLLRKRLGN